tara:strand:- start:797 stop:1351 length:555 start_codon:yes stop_codon:yes gene_type:complete
MDNNIQKGRLKRWNDAKGFGFIKSDNQPNDVFVHISSLKGMSRRPQVGDTIFYNIQIDNDGKQSAFNARIDGVDVIQPIPKRKSKIAKSKSTNHRFIKLLILFILLLIAFFIYDKNVGESTIILNQLSPLITKETGTLYSCKGKRHCSEMTSCEEAKFYLNNCPGTSMDGDNDGVPCESQWCNW